MATQRLSTLLAATAPLVVDGAMATELEKLGVDTATPAPTICRMPHTVNSTDSA